MLTNNEQPSRYTPLFIEHECIRPAFHKDHNPEKMPSYYCSYYYQRMTISPSLLTF